MPEPQFKLRPCIKRALLPKIFMLLFLSVFLLLAVWLNAIILNLAISPGFTIGVILVLFLLVLIELYYTYVKISGWEYLFFDDRIAVRNHYLGKKKYVSYSAASRIKHKRNIIDSVFNTGTIHVEPGVKLKHIKKPVPVFKHIEKSVHHHRKI